MRISSIVVHGATTRVIGTPDGLPWNLPDDMARFKRITSFHPVIMGRKTYGSIPAHRRPLARRTTIVLTRSTTFHEPGVIVVYSLEEAWEAARASPGNDECFVIGGGEIYSLALPFTDRLYATVVDDDPPGNTFFPEYESLFTKVLEQDERRFEGPLRYTLRALERG